MSDRELFALIEVLIRARTFSRIELLTLIDKLKKFTTADDRPKLEELICKGLYHYREVKHDCKSVQETLRELMNCITDWKENTIGWIGIGSPIGSGW